MSILSINFGSSSLKFAVYARGMVKTYSGRIEGLQQKSVKVFSEKSGNVHTKTVRGPLSALQAFREVKKLIEQAGGVRSADIETVGHRIVYGGTYAKPTPITPAVLRQLGKYVAMAPLHQQHDLDGVVAAQKAFPRARQIGVFDTSYFHRLPEQAREYALPRNVRRKLQVYRVGFHGPSHEHAAQFAAKKTGRPLRSLKLITIHLGSGCSMTAVANGKPIDTSMGFTPLEGLLMSTRSGDIDPGILLFLLRQGWTVELLDNVLNKKSGWYGLSGFTDFRDVLKAAGYPVPNWKLAGRVSALQRRQCRTTVDVVLHRLVKYLGAYWALLGKVDAVVLTGAMGSGSAWLRKALRTSSPIFQRAHWLAVAADEERLIAEAARRVSR